MIFNIISYPYSVIARFLFPHSFGYLWSTFQIVPGELLSAFFHLPFYIILANAELRSMIYCAGDLCTEFFFPSLYREINHDVA